MSSAAAESQVKCEDKKQEICEQLYLEPKQSNSTLSVAAASELSASVAVEARVVEKQGEEEEERKMNQRGVK